MSASEKHLTPESGSYNEPESKEAVVDEIIRLQKELLVLSSRSDQLQVENEKLRSEGKIYADYTTNLEKRINDLSNNF